MAKYKKGDIIKVNVTGITEYGVFVKTDYYYTGMIHISEVSNKYVQNLNKFVIEGENIFAEILECDEINKQLKLSIKNIQYRNNGIKKRKIVETKHGFQTLLYNLPRWVQENIKNSKNEANSIDK